jgi:hypothetical protein
MSLPGFVFSGRHAGLGCSANFRAGGIQTPAFFQLFLIWIDLDRIRKDAERLK